MSNKLRQSGLSLVSTNAEPLVRAKASAEDAVRADGSLDWSIYMARAQRGDHHAYRRLLEELTPYVRVLAARRMRNQTDVEDTVQNILMTVHAVRHTYDPTRPFGPWLVTIANRRIADELRRLGNLAAREAQLDDEHEGLAAFDPPPDQAADAGLLRKMVDSLPPAQRDAVTMLKLEEMSLKEAAAKSGMSIAALKVSAHRALQNLRKKVTKRGRSA
jgi:RNA polymerase sigma factor (sigma-70 family)